MTPPRFPVMVPRRLDLDSERRDGVPAIVLLIPWALLEPHRARVEADWCHSLEFLATEDRGGLMAHELVAILENREVRLMPRAESNARLLELMVINDAVTYLEGMEAEAMNHGWVDASSPHAAYRQGVRESAEGLRCAAGLPGSPKRLAKRGDSAPIGQSAGAPK